MEKPRTKWKTFFEALGIVTFFLLVGTIGYVVWSHSTDAYSAHARDMQYVKVLWQKTGHEICFAYAGKDDPREVDCSKIPAHEFKIVRK